MTEKERLEISNRLLQQQHKPRIVISVLGSTERHGWVNPWLTYELIKLSHNQDYEVRIEMITDNVLHDFARNLAMDSARKQQAIWNLQLDNDISMRCDVLSLIGQLSPDMLVVGMPYGIKHDGRLRLCADGEHEKRGQFVRVDKIGAGALLVNRQVWEQVNPPWFRWIPQEDSLLSMGTGEDVYFCDQLKKAGIAVWASRMLAGHYRTLDASEIVAREMMQPVA